MRVFNLFLKIINKHKGMVIMYLSIMMVVLALSVSQLYSEDKLNFIEMNIAVFDHENSRFSQHFTDYILKDSNRIDLPEDRDVIADKFYDDTLDYALIIPKNFSESFAADPNSVELETISMLNQQVAAIVEGKITSYLNIWNQYHIIYNRDIPQDKIPGIITEVDYILEASVESDAIQEQPQSNGVQVFAFAMRYINYVIIALGFSIVGYTFIVMEEPLTIIRERVSGYPEGKRTREMFLAAFVVMTGIWLILLMICLSFAGFGNIFLKAGLSVIASSYIHLMAVTGLVLFVSNLYPKKNSSNFFGNIFSLITAFSTGIFIQREILYQPLLKASSITPTYWDVSNSTHIAETVITNIDYGFILQNCIVMAVMGLAFILLTFVVRRIRLKEGI